jgi:hypothetical protein
MLLFTYALLPLFSFRMLALGLVGGGLAVCMKHAFKRSPSPTGLTSDLMMKSAGSLVSIFGQHPSHGVLGSGSDRDAEAQASARRGAHDDERTTGADITVAMFYASCVIVLGIVSMQYAGNLAAIQSKPTVVPVLDSIADLFGQKVLTSTLYAPFLPNHTTSIASISNNADMIKAVKQVDSGQVDAFVYDALGVLMSLREIEATKESVCVYAMKKRVYPFEIGFGVGKDIAPEFVMALQESLQRLDTAGTVRTLRQTFLDGLNKYIGVPVCPGSAQGLTSGQTAGVYVVPAVVLTAILICAGLAMCCGKYKPYMTCGRRSRNTIPPSGSAAHDAYPAHRGTHAHQDSAPKF